MEEPMRVLVVDDSAMARMNIREELEAGGYQVMEASNGLEALVRISGDTPPDLVTLDVEMPRLNGWDTCRRLRSDHYVRMIRISGKRRLPVIFITGQDSMADRKKGFESGAANFIAKPFAPGELLEAVDHILKPVALSDGMTAIVVEDNVVARKIVAGILSQEGLMVIEAEDGQQGYEIFKNHGENIDVVITDLFMPRMNGDEFARRIRREFDRWDIPIICLTAMPDQSELLKVFKAGVSDYLVKPFAKEELLARITVHLERYRLSRQLKEKVAALKESNEKIRKLSITDPLTGCYNRNFIAEHLQKELKRTRRYGSCLSVALADIDHFKKVNDTWGHSAGDVVLKTFVETMHEILRTDVDWVARYGGEEFVIVLPETDFDEALACTERLQKAVAQRTIHHEDAAISITASFGVTCLDPGAVQDVFPTDRLIDRADKYLYTAKENGRNRVEGGLFSI